MGSRRQDGSILIGTGLMHPTQLIFYCFLQLDFTVTNYFLKHQN